MFYEILLRFINYFSSNPKISAEPQEMAAEDDFRKVIHLLLLSMISALMQFCQAQPQLKL